MAICLLGRGSDGELFPSEAYKDSDLGFLHEIDEMSKNERFIIK